MTANRFCAGAGLALSAALMLSDTQITAAKGIADLPPVQSDSLLQLIGLANADKRPEKIDVGVGVYRDGDRPHADPARGQSGRETAVGDAGEQGLSRQQG